MNERLPEWEQGPHGLLAFFGIGGDCCPFCAADSHDGIEIPLVNINGVDIEVCCRHVDAIRAGVEAREAKRRREVPHDRRRAALAAGSEGGGDVVMTGLGQSDSPIHKIDKTAGEGGGETA